jgi:hypothetical protein
MADPTEAPVGTGIVKGAMDKITAMKKYNTALTAAQENGDSLPPFHEWYAAQAKASSATGLLGADKEEEK